jgi:hypothetical protein
MAVTATLAVMMLGRLSLQAAEEIKNGDFSQGLEGWACKAFDPSDRGVQASQRKPGEIMEDRPGNKVVQITLDRKEYIHLSQEFHIRKAQKKFMVSMRAKASADFSSTNSSLIVFLRASDMNTRDPAHWRAYPLTPGADWQIFTADLQSVTKGTVIEVYVKLLQGTGKVWVDDISVDSLDSAGKADGPLQR